MSYKSLIRISLVLLSLSVAGCQSSYYSVMEVMGYHKRDIMVERVEDAQQSQQDAQQQFQSALDQLTELISYEGGDLEQQYEQTKDNYEASQDAADDVEKRIDDIEDVAIALFAEWEDEIEQYTNKDLRRRSEKQLATTKRDYEQLIRSMDKAHSRMEPVLAALKDNTLFLKHNLNAQAVGAIADEFETIKRDITVLMSVMNKAIEDSESFIKMLEKKR